MTIHEAAEILRAKSITNVDVFGFVASSLTLVLDLLPEALEIYAALLTAAILTYRFYWGVIYPTIERRKKKKE